MKPDDWILLLAVFVGVMLVPPKYDPAILLKEWLIRRGWSKW